MSRIITANSFSFNVAGGSCLKTRRKAKSNSRVLTMNDKKTTRTANMNLGGAKLSLLSVCFVLTTGIVLLGAYYLYQVNDLATKSYEMKDMETKIQELQKEGKKMEIREVELRSMYNLEKATENLDLVNAQNVTYVEMKSPVAMK
jgi:hypothetical protein